MDTPDDPPTEPADPLALGWAAASQLGGDWQIDSPDEFVESAPEEEPEEAEGGRSEEPSAPAGPPPLALFPNHVAAAPQDVPPSPEQLIEAMLFVGGHPLTATVACSAIRGLTPEHFRIAVDSLNRRYRDQRRPYAVEVREDGFVLVVRPMFRSLRERIFGGPRETRLSQPALDVLSVVAYRQPVSKVEVDSVRGTDSGAVLRQLVRLGLVTVQHRAESAAREVRYGTTPRFLHVFGLISLDELPRLGEPQQG